MTEQSEKLKDDHALLSQKLLDIVPELMDLQRGVLLDAQDAHCRQSPKLAESLTVVWAELANGMDSLVSALTGLYAIERETR